MQDVLQTVSEPQRRTSAYATSKKKLPRRNNLVLIAVGLFAIAWFALETAADAYDNDLWFLIATGREIVDNGIPQVNPWSMHEGLDVVVQQWIPAVILYLTYNAFGIVGIDYLVFIQIMVLVGCLYALCRVCSGVEGRGGEVFLIIIGLAIPALSVYWSSRPHLYSMIMFAVVLIILEKYRRTEDARVLIALPIATCVHVNLHMSMAPFDLFVIALYLVPDVFALLRAKGLRLRCGFLLSTYPRKPLALAFVAACVSMLVNPYGLDGALYLVESYGAASYGSYINEMGAASLWIDYGFAFMASTVLGAMVVGRNGLRRINFPLSVLFIVLIPLSAMHVRNIWLLSLFTIALVAQGFGRFSLDIPRARYFSNRVVFAGLAAVFAIILVFHAGSVISDTPLEEQEGGDDDDIPQLAIAYLDEYVEKTGLQKSDLKIFNPFNVGGYFEWHGYRVFMDPRPELWEPGITKVDRHYYQEFVDLAQGRLAAQEVVEEYDFDFLMVYPSSKISSYLSTDEDYTKVVTGDGYTLWTKTIIADYMER